VKPDGTITGAETVTVEIDAMPDNVIGVGKDVGNAVMTAIGAAKIDVITIALIGTRRAILDGMTIIMAIIPITVHPLASALSSASPDIAVTAGRHIAIVSIGRNTRPIPTIKRRRLVNAS